MAARVIGLYRSKLKALTYVLCFVSVTSEAVFSRTAAQGMYQLLSGVLQPGANVY